jgi:predicted AAA+ superfamily ATPase
LKQKIPEEVLFVSMDNIFFTSNTLFNLAYEFYKTGGRYIYIDEVHKYPNWSQEIKNIYDSFDELKIIFTSSSALEINKGKYDLSRRALIYELPGLSFREFLELKYSIKLPATSLQEISSNHVNLTSSYLKEFKPFKYFSEYLKTGYYPYFVKEKEFYHQQLLETINLVLETDLPAIYNIDYNSVVKLKRLLFIISSVVPYIPNVNKLAQQVGTTRDSLLKYLHLLHNAHIVSWISSDAFGINFMNKPDRLYLENTNIAFALNPKPNIGTIRETYFYNQLQAVHKVTYPKQGDFLIDNKYLFEIGGRNKTKQQITGVSNAFVAADDIEYGFGNTIPLWLFGFLY